MDAIVENLERKGDLLRRFAAARQRGALFISTTSGLSITELGRRGACADLLAGTHFWNPPHLMPLVEVIRGAETPDWRDGPRVRGDDVDREDPGPRQPRRPRVHRQPHAARAVA